MMDDIDRLARQICRDRDPQSPICTDAPCWLCLDMARKEIEYEQVRQKAAPE